MFAPRPSIGHPFVRFCLALTLLLTALSVPAATPSAIAASSTVVISQVYGGGGNTGATYTHDFIELFNRGTTTVSLSGWSIQYTSATGTGNFGASATQLTELPAVSLTPGQYFLVQEATGGATGSALPTPDVVDATPINMSGTNGKVALVNSVTPLGCNGSSTACSPAALAQIIDLVGYGTANFSEGAAAPAPTNNTTSMFRRNGGCTETDDNNNDFEVLAITPRNTGTTPAPCGGSGNDPITPTCGGTLTTETGTEATRNVTATDPNGTVVSAEVTNVTPAPAAGSIAITSSAPAAGPGGMLQATLTVNASVPAGSYSATITFANNDATPQTTTCTITIEVTSPAGTCPSGVALTSIPVIQGSGAASPIEGTTVTLQGIVTGDFQGNALLGGFYVQDPTGDGAISTSDGVFVYVPDANPRSAVDVNVGDLVRLTGQVKEFNTLTEIDSVSAVTVCSAETPLAPTAVDLPVATASDMERYEGMLVTFPEPMTVSQNFFQGRYGQVHLSAEGRMYTPTNDQGNSAEYNLRRSIVLDDGRSSQNPNPIPYISEDNTLRAGDTTTGLTGLMHYGPINSDTSIRGYTLHPTITPSFARTNPRTAGPPAVGGELKVASFNVLNYFTTIDQTGASCFPSGTRSDCRGADSAAEFQRQRDKIIAALVEIDADVVGLIEIENNGATAIGNLVSGLNAATAPGTYAAVADPTFIGGDAIKVALIYKPGRLSLVGTAASSSDPIFDRPPVAQTFQDASGEKFTVIVNHFKSKGSCPSNPSDPNADQGDGQGCWNAKRVEQAQELLGFINQRITASGDTDVLVIGDLNAYGQEDPIDTLVASGMVNQVAVHVPLAERYSYIFDGQSGYLDHGLSTQSLSSQVTDVTFWHINADEPSVIDYNTEFKPQDLYTPTPYRSSDHDPVIIGLNLGTMRYVYLPIVAK